MAEFKLRELTKWNKTQLPGGDVYAERAAHVDAWYLRYGCSHYSLATSGLVDLAPTIKADIDWPTFAQISRLPEWVARTLYERSTPATRAVAAIEGHPAYSPVPVYNLAADVETKWHDPAIGRCNAAEGLRCGVGVDLNCGTVGNGCPDLIPAEPKPATTEEAPDVSYDVPGIGRCAELESHRCSGGVNKDCLVYSSHGPCRYLVAPRAEPKPTIELYIDDEPQPHVAFNVGTTSADEILRRDRMSQSRAEIPRESRLQSISSYSPRAQVQCQGDEDGDV